MLETSSSNDGFVSFHFFASFMFLEGLYRVHVRLGLLCLLNELATLPF